MSKKSFYFSHDYNARNDEKIINLRMKLGAEGYGIYFMLLEKLVETENYILVRDYNAIAFDVRVNSSVIKSVVEDFGLFDFTEDGKCLYSESLIRRMKPLDAQRKQRSEAGKASAEKRKSRVRETISQEQQVQRPLPENPTTAERPLLKNSTEKVKESKVNNSNNTLYGEFSSKIPRERKQEPTQESKTENTLPLKPEEEPLSKSCVKKFSPPTVEQVRDYCNERQNGISPEEFCDFYQSINWMVGKNKMKDWKAAVRNWENRRKKENGKQNTRPNQPNDGKVSGTTEILNGIRYFEAT